MSYQRRAGETERVRRDALGFAIVLLFAEAALYRGWQLFWFITDDAYIAFRYVSNSILGHGYVWNAPPFLPVEGYTSFLWVVLLDAAWRFFGAEPPQSANLISLFFTGGSLAVAGTMLMKLRWHERLAPRRIFFLIMFVAFLLLNRTFLEWSSSGLETAMFSFFIAAWVYSAVFVQRPTLRAAACGWSAALLALTRPDGYLFCLASFAITVLLALPTEQRGRTARILLCGLLPFCVVAAHLAWRFSFYGEWLPNTYYAKQAPAWPESGARYLLSFVLEYGLWFALLIIGAALAAACRRARRPCSQQAVITLLMLVPIGAHFAFYTFVVGGDHFEYRMYAHLIPLAGLAVLWSINRLAAAPLPAAAVVCAVLLLSLPVQWSQWALTKDLDLYRLATAWRYTPLAPAWPRAVRWYAALFDDTQRWLLRHFVGTRYEQHKAFMVLQITRYPRRAGGLRVGAGSLPVYVRASVGYPGWVLPHVNILDEFGLNDYIVARMPATRRFMAHYRLPPKGYLESYRPNVVVRRRRAVVLQREEPFTANDIAALERYWRLRLPELRRGAAARAEAE